MSDALATEGQPAAALKLRQAGQGYAEIAAGLGIDEQAARELVGRALEQQLLDDGLAQLRLDALRLEEILAGIRGKANAGDRAAVEQTLKIMEALEALRGKLATAAGAALQPAFPAPAAAPGQAESRNAYEAFITQREHNPWWGTYVKLRETWDWRKAAFIAWSAMPTHKRLPSTQEELAQLVLGLRNTSTIRKWRTDDPTIDQAIEQARLALAGDRLSDVLDSWAEVATWRDPAAHRDRITFLEWQQVYKGEGLRVGGLDGGPLRVEDAVGRLDDDGVDALIDTLLSALPVITGGDRAD